MDNKLSDAGYPIQIGDQEYTASMLTDRDYGDLDQYIQSVFIRMGCNAAELLDDESKKRELKSLALKDATQIGWGTSEGINIIATVDGILHLGFQMIRKRHAKILFSEFKQQALKNLSASINEINLIDRRLNYTIIDDDKKPGGASAGNEKSV